MAAQRELRQIGQKEEFLFCLHFIGYKIQTLARRQEFKSNWPKKNVLFTFYWRQKSNTGTARRREFAPGQKEQKTVFVLSTFYWRKNQTLAWRRELRQIRQKEEFLFCLHFIGYKIQTLARRRELRQIGQQRTKNVLFLFCLHFIGDKIQRTKEQKIFCFCFVYILVATWRVCSNMTNWPKNTKNLLFLFLFCLYFIGASAQSSQQVP
jgi:hypothetical protein